MARRAACRSAPRAAGGIRSRCSGAAVRIPVARPNEHLTGRDHGAGEVNAPPCNAPGARPAAARRAGRQTAEWWTGDEYVPLESPSRGASEQPDKRVPCRFRTRLRAGLVGGGNCRPSLAPRCRRAGPAAPRRTTPARRRPRRASGCRRTIARRRRSGRTSSSLQRPRCFGFQPVDPIDDVPPGLRAFQFTLKKQGVGPHGRAQGGIATVLADQLKGATPYLPIRYRHRARLAPAPRGRNPRRPGRPAIAGLRVIPDRQRSRKSLGALHRIRCRFRLFAAASLAG